jgi:hippurate hydrolase
MEDLVTIDGETIGRMTAWRRDLHAHPELAFAETRTAGLVARELAACGVAVRTGIGRTGVVGTLQRGQGPSIGLRADMDALPIVEATGLPYASRTPGVMHACGHDGHVAMLLGAARHLAGQADFRGTVHFIFQPAEECERGGRAMVEDGLFRDFPCDSVWGLHNWPGLPLGSFATRGGPIMAALDTFEIRVHEGVAA